MAALSMDAVMLTILSGLILLLLAYWVNASHGLGVNMLREWLCLSFSDQNGKDAAAPARRPATALGELQNEWGDPNPPEVHFSDEPEPDGIILSEGPYARPLASRAFYPVLFTVLTLCLAGLMAGVAIPLKGFIEDKVQARAIKYELANVQRAVDLMMIEHGLASLPDPGPGSSGSLRKDPADATSDMSSFPYMAQGEYALFAGPSGDYLGRVTEALYYVDVAGVVHQVIPENR